jgi:hypothetical protein
MAEFKHVFDFGVHRGLGAYDPAKRDATGDRTRTDTLDAAP